MHLTLGASTLALVCLTTVRSAPTAPSTHQDRNPAVSPDGRWIAFESRRDGNSDIYICGVDGSGLRRLTKNPGVEGAPSWSPDGKQIAYNGLRSDNYDIYVIQVDGSDERRLTTHAGLDLGASWAKDGKSIYYASQRSNGDQLRSVDLKGEHDVLVTGDIEHHHRFELSPDGERLLGVCVTRGEWDLVTMNPDGSERVLIAQHGARDGMPSWAHDGERIAFGSKRFGGKWQVFVTSRDNFDLVRLTSEGVNTGPAWLADDERIVFASNREGDLRLYTMNADGTEQLPLNPQADQPDSKGDSGGGL